MVQIIRKTSLPLPHEVDIHLADAARKADTLMLREPRPPGFPLLFYSNMELIEPAVAFLHEHSIQRAHTADTLRTYTEILCDWFEALEQKDINWATADAVDLISYRNRMIHNQSPRTKKPYKISTINHRIRGVLRFYEWAVKRNWLEASELCQQSSSFGIARRPRINEPRTPASVEHSLFVLRQFENLPTPLTSSQIQELLAKLTPPHDLMARWQLYTGLRIGEILRLTVESVEKAGSASQHQTIEVARKGGKFGSIIASKSLLEETHHYIGLQRRAWLNRAKKRGKKNDEDALFINQRGSRVAKSTYQRAVAGGAKTVGFKATSHLLRATFACMLLARLERLASQGAFINPLLVVKTLMGHERIETTDRYLRAIATDTYALKNVLETLLSEDA